MIGTHEERGLGRREEGEGRKEKGIQVEFDLSQVDTNPESIIP